MKPAWSILLFTTLAGAGQGLFLSLFAASFLSAPATGFLLWGAGAALGLTGLGLIASFFHLGRPERAWRTAAMWRTSWLSREVIVLPLFMALVAAWAVFLHLQMPRGALAAGAAAAIACLALFACTGMIYACLKFLQEWHTPLTLVNFLLLGCASGLTAAAALAAWRHPALAWPFCAAALAAGALGYLTRLASLARNMRLRPKSTLASAIGVKHERIVQISQGAMGGSYNTREFFHGRSRARVTAVRWLFLALAFPLPAALVLSDPRSAVVLAAAFVAQWLGLLAERWYFFAEAKHPQNLYYQAIA